MSDTGYRYLEVKRNLAAEIAAMQPNERLPSRTTLAIKYNAARTTVERAISELIGEGALYARDGSGTYVASKTNLEPVHWGLVLPDIMHDTYPGILRGVEDAANECGINVIVCNTDNQTAKQAHYIQKLIQSGVRGMIIVPAIIGATDLELIKKLASLRIPFVCCNRGIEGIEAPRVVSNNFYGAYLAVRHLCESGRRYIAYLSNPQYSVSLERYQGYLSALSESQRETREEFVMFEPAFDLAHAGYDNMQRLLALSPRPDAVFCFNDRIAKGAYRAIEEAGLRVGADIALAGYDNTHICEQLPVKLTSVKFRTYEIGRKAAQLLIEMMNSTRVPYNQMIVLQPELVVRESSATGQTALGETFLSR